MHPYCGRCAALYWVFLRILIKGSAFPRSAQKRPCQNGVSPGIQPLDRDTLQARLSQLYIVSFDGSPALWGQHICKCHRSMRQTGTIRWRPAGNFLAKGQWLYQPGKGFEEKAEKREAGNSVVAEWSQFAARERSRVHPTTLTT